MFHYQSKQIEIGSNKQQIRPDPRGYGFQDVSTSIFQTTLKKSTLPCKFIGFIITNSSARTTQHKVHQMFTWMLRF